MKTQKAVQVPIMMEALQLMRQLPDDIRVIRRLSGLGRAGLSRTIGVSRWTLLGWELGRTSPRESFITLCIILWAKKLRGEKAVKVGKEKGDSCRNPPPGKSPPLVITL